jgi:hypothetical protein
MMAATATGPHHIFLRASVLLAAHIVGWHWFSGCRSGIGAIWIEDEGVLDVTGDHLNHVRTCATTLNNGVDMNFMPSHRRPQAFRITNGQ